MTGPDHHAPPPATGRAAAAIATWLDAAVPRCALALSAAVRRSVAISVVSSVPTTAAAAGALEGRTWFRLGRPGERCGAVVLAPADVVRFADVLLGGPGAGSDTRAPGRLELMLVSDALTAALFALTELLAAQGVGAAAVQPVTGPAELALDGRLVTATLEVTLGKAELSLDLLLPLAAHALPADHAEVDPGAALVQSLATVPTELAVRFAPVRLRAGDVDDLEVGDLIRLEQPAEPRVIGEVGGRPVFRGRTGRHGRRLAVQVVELEEIAEGETAS